MKLRHVPSDQEIRERRKDAYLKAWPIEKQMEALTESAMGRPEKLNKLLQEFSGIRESIPFSKEDKL